MRHPFAIMTDHSKQPETASIASPDDRAAIVERLYDVAVDPIRLEDLLEVWELKAAPLRQGRVEAAIPLEDAEIEAHLRRAAVFLDRFDAAQDEAGSAGAEPGAPSVLEDIPRSAAFLNDGGPVLGACNRAATIAFGIQEGAPLADLPFEAEDIETLRATARRVAGRRGEQPVSLRLRSRVTGSPVILRISPVESAARPPLALILSTERVWPEGFDRIVQEAFGLTGAEAEIVHGLTLGLPLRDIAEARGRSVETVRTQVRSVLAKTETHSQSELLRVIFGLMEVVTVSPGAPLPVAPAGGLSPLPLREMRKPDGRRLTWIEFGDPAGAPVLYMHLDYGLIRWPAAAERAARARGWRVIVPVRAGYGKTDLHAKGSDHRAEVTRDYASVMDQLGLSKAAVLCLGADLRFAMTLARSRPDLVTGILGCACQLPLRNSSQYDRMDKWQRFILANARYAPKVLPFLVQAGFALARRLGKEAFFSQVNGGSPADLATFAKADVREAMLLGSDVCLTRTWSAHEAFTRECIGSEKDWSAAVRECPVPVHLLQGDQDPQSPVQTIRELMQDFPALRVEFLPNTGQLLFFAEWQRALEALHPMVQQPDRQTGR